MMQRTFSLIVVLSILFLAIGSSSAQVGAGACTVERKLNTGEAGIARLTFLRPNDSVEVPDVMVVLNCDTEPELLELIDPAPAFPRNTAPPRPKNDADATDDLPGYAIVNTSAANLRSGPGPGFTRVAVVDGGDRLVVLGRNRNETWWYVQAGDTRGWIWGQIVVLRGSLRNVPYMEAVGEIIQPTLVVSFAGNPVYDELSAAGRAICSIPGGGEWNVVARNSRSTWFLIETVCQDGTPITGWISADKGVLRNPGAVNIPVQNR